MYCEFDSHSSFMHLTFLMRNMSKLTLTLSWKLIKKLDHRSPLSSDNVVFNVGPNEGLFSQFNIPLQYGYVPQILFPTVTYHQKIKNILNKKFGIVINEKNYPYRIYLKQFNSNVSLNLKIRHFQPGILSLTVTLSDLPFTLDANKLVEYQNIRHLEPISEIIRYTIGMVEALSHKNITLSEIPHSYPAVYLDGVCNPEEFQNYLNKNKFRNTKILLRYSEKKPVSDEVVDRINKKNKEHNLSSPQEYSLIDKQGLLYLTSGFQEDWKKRREMFFRTHDLFEIAAVFHKYIENYSSYRLENEHLADFLLYKIKKWIENPRIIFNKVLKNENMWTLLISEFRLDTMLESTMKEEIKHSISEKSSSFDFFNKDWWKRLNFEETLSNKLIENGLLPRATTHVQSQKNIWTKILSFLTLIESNIWTKIIAFLTFIVLVADFFNALDTILSHLHL